MSTYRELVYLVLDELKGTSDDFTYTEDHIIFLLNKYRAFLLKQKYSDIRKINLAFLQAIYASVKSLANIFKAFH